VLATQCLLQKKIEDHAGARRGALGPGVTAKDIALAIIGASAPPAVPATPSNSAAARSVPCRWKAA
jgi:hypothetical protein